MARTPAEPTSFCQMQRCKSTHPPKMGWHGMGCENRGPCWGSLVELVRCIWPGRVAGWLGGTKKEAHVLP